MLRRNAEAPREVTICGTVLRVERGPRRRSGVEAYVAVRIPGSDPLLPIQVVINEPREGTIPARPGDAIVAHGRYFNDGTRDGIDWTHHGTSPNWPHPGYIILNGQRYE